MRFYADRLEMFRRSSGASAIGDLNPAAMKTWLLGLRRRGASSATLVNYDKAIACLRQLAAPLGVPARPPPGGPAQAAQQRLHGHNLDARGRSGAPGGRQGVPVAAAELALLISLLLDTGMRAGEVSGLRLRDVGWAEGTLEPASRDGSGRALSRTHHADITLRLLPFTDVRA